LYKLQQRGFTIVSVYDGEERVKIDSTKSNLASRKEAIEVITSVDESQLIVKKGDIKASLYILLGNDPEELVYDYTDWDELDMVVNEHSFQWQGKKCPVVAD
jgi:hypothetical protein